MIHPDQPRPFIEADLVSRAEQLTIEPVIGYQAVPGGRLMVLSGLGPAGKLRQLLPQPPLHGSFWRPDLSYDARKVLAALAAAIRRYCDADEVTLGLSGELDPAVVRPGDSDQDEYIAVVMPMRI